MKGLRSVLVVGCLVWAASAMAVVKKELILLMPVRVDAKVSQELMDQLPLFVRAAHFKNFTERNFGTISPVQLTVSESEMNTKLSDAANWKPEVFDKLAERWKARYVSSVAIVSVENHQGAVEGTAGGPPPPGGQMTTTIKLMGSLYDHKSKKFVFEAREISVDRKTGVPGPNSVKVSGEMLSAINDGVYSLFRSFLIKYRKVERDIYDRDGARRR